MTSPDDRPNSSSLSVTRRAFLGAGAAAGVTGALGTSGCTDNGVSESQLNGSAFGGRPNTEVLYGEAGMTKGLFRKDSHLQTIGTCSYLSYCIAISYGFHKSS